MKKETVIKILGIVTIVIAINIFVLLFVFKTIKAPRKTITTKEFISKLESKKFKIYDTREQYKESEYIKESTIALSEDETYKIEFYIISNEEDAITLFDHNKELLKTNSNSPFTYINKNISNFSKYEQISNEKYSVISRIGNTLIYLNVDLDYKEDCKRILKEFGY